MRAQRASEDKRRDGGGEIIAAGTPEDIAKEKRSYTGPYIKRVLAKKDGGPKKQGRKAAE